jgi:hypothetical protein
MWPVLVKNGPHVGVVVGGMKRVLNAADDAGIRISALGQSSSAAAA